MITSDEFDQRTLLRLEKEVLGQFVTDHPLLGVKERLAALADMEIAETEGLGDGDLVTVAGIVASVSRRYTKKGEPYAQFRLEDLAGGVMVVVFPGQYESLQHLLEHDSILLVKGRADRRGRGEELQLRAVEITEPDLGDGGRPSPPARPAGDRPHRAELHRHGDRHAQGAARGAQGLVTGAGAVPFVAGRAALRRRHVPGRTRRRPALRAAGAARHRGRASGAARTRRRRRDREPGVPTPAG